MNYVLFGNPSYSVNLPVALTWCDLFKEQLQHDILNLNKKFLKELIHLLSQHYFYILYFSHLKWKLNSLQSYDTQTYSIVHRLVQRLPQHNIRISHHLHI
jgi:hypothetical protein